MARRTAPRTNLTEAVVDRADPRRGVRTDPGVSEVWVALLACHEAPGTTGKSLQHDRWRYERHLAHLGRRRWWRAVRGARDLATRELAALLALTGVRRGSLQRSRWGQIDLAALSWRIPASEMKARCDHEVPFSPCRCACSLRHDREAWFRNVQQGTGCPGCVVLTRPSRTRTPADCHAAGAERGTEWLGPAVPTAHPKSQWYPPAGHAWETIYATIEDDGRVCAVCARERRPPAAPDALSNG